MCGRGDMIRTCDPLVPNQMRYQTALRPEAQYSNPNFSQQRPNLLRRTLQQTQKLLFDLAGSHF